MNRLITTSDGSHTIYVPGLDEHYHSVHGAVQESEFIFIGQGFSRSTGDPLNIFEVGFGTGLNVLLTAVRSQATQRKVFFTSIEKYPVDEQFVTSLNHMRFAGKSGRDLYTRIHSAPWNEWTEITDNFRLLKIKGDMTEYKLSGNYDLIYFDAFGPDKQPEMWTKKIFSSIARATVKGGVLVTYSAKGEVKRNLIACGFEVSLLPGPPGKRQIIRAVKI
jgi:tRNA U34 5-methylaminomethyl-2-thiouridine-forming methyltransferase MnmC